MGHLRKEVSESHFLNLYSIALSDTQVDSTELLQLYEFGKNRGVSKQKIDDLLLHADQVTFTIPDDLLDKIELLYEFAILIWADGKVDEFEKTALMKFCFKFGFEKDNVEEMADFLIEQANKDVNVEEVKSKVLERVQSND